MSHHTLIEELERESQHAYGHFKDLLERAAAALRTLAPGRPLNMSCPNGCTVGVEGRLRHDGVIGRLRCLRCDKRWVG
jgi:hypothetical protein